MKLIHPVLFWTSIVNAGLAILIASKFNGVMAPTITRDFNFGEPMIYCLIGAQLLTSGYGVFRSLKK